MLHDLPAEDLFDAASTRAKAYLASTADRLAAPSPEAVAALARFREPLPAAGTEALDVVRLLDEFGSPATVATTGGRYFGLVMGGALPVTVAANWLAAAWDQNAVFRWTSPVAAELEDVALGWFGELFDLPAGFGGAFVSGSSMASVTALAAARHAVFARAGWDVEEEGLAGAPPVTIVVSEEQHPSILKALSLLGFGRNRCIRVPVDDQGRMRADALPPLDERTIVCIQAGNVNTGAFDPAAEICARAREAGAWVHVDGAFGLWAKAAASRASLSAGFEQADSWSTDAHKWLNVPYDSGLVFVREPKHLRAAMSATAAYLLEGEEGAREPSHFTPEMSRRARSIEVWAALKHLGRDGVADLVERCCAHARHFARGLQARGYEVLNEVVLNQVLVSFGSPESTRAVIAELQSGGICWCGGTVWQGRTAMRISVSSWATTAKDVELSLETMDRAARRVAARIENVPMAGRSR
ncbi:pyridoxal phosphate-dependent decarboxylase family protein [Rhizomicrobium electricum]|uniref:Pyridoxal-dependent decarboxylase n=1 Tax=Rhizomicrobium electricum TaxID=480070 RepID=A0ABP3Q0Y5_9PROT|nr:aminotransferase class V-fold PLP-dependent enzyme [Rhizomicrobium electricum]NIJ50170.1 glutamate/tyrosine decarboxylase-like PLP-dependent enzyme [Rhizomicrobium electricum]